jgi:hypothetical protein
VASLIVIVCGFCQRGWLLGELCFKWLSWPSAFLPASNFFTSFFQRKLEILKKKKVEKLAFANKSLLDNMPSRYARKFMPVLYNVHRL